MLSARSIMPLTSSFMSAAIGTSSWEAAMDDAAATGSVGAVMIPAAGSAAGVPCSQSIGATTEAYVRDGWIARDERKRAIPVMVRRGVMTDFDVFTPDQIARHPYYQEFLRPHGLCSFAGLKIQIGRDLWALSIQRSIKQEPFMSGELKVLASASRRLASAVAVAEALGFARVDRARAAFDATGTAVALIDRFGEVSSINSAAERMLGPHLRIQGRRLVSSSHVATVALDRALYALIWMAAPPCGVPVVLPRPIGRPLAAYPCRLPPVTEDWLGPARAIVVLHDLEGRRQPLISESLLGGIFQLTPTEARVAARVGAGETIARVGDDLDISYATVRSHLKVIMQKTETHRQAELVSLVARLGKESVGSTESWTRSTIP